MVNIPKLNLSEYGKERCEEIQSGTKADVKYLIANHFFWHLYEIENQDQDAIKEFATAREKDEFVVDVAGLKFTVSSLWFNDFEGMLNECREKVKDPFTEGCPEP